MESKFDNEKVIPIERGQEIKLEKLRERVQKIQEDAMSLYGRLIKLENEKQVQLDEELKNPTEKQNLELISLLSGDLEEIRKHQGTLDNSILESFDKLDELRERIDKMSE